MLKKLISIVLAITLLATSVVVIANGGATPDCGIYLGEKSLTQFCPGDIYAKGVAPSGERAVLALMLFKDGTLTDIEMSASDNGEVKTSPIKITDVTGLTMKAILVTGLGTEPPVTVTKEFTGVSELDTNASFDQSAYFRIENVMLGKCLYDSGTEVLYDTYTNRDNFLWQIVPAEEGGLYVINKGTGKYLSSAADGTKINCGDIDTRGLSAWNIEALTETDYTLRNGRNKKYLAVDESSGFPRCNVSRAPEAQSTWQAHWKIIDLKTPVGNDAKEFADYNAADYNQNQITVLTPKYYSDVSGTVRVKFYAPQAAYVLAKCHTVKDGKDEYADLAVIPVNKDGFGAFDLPCDEYAYGPLNINLYSYKGSAVNDICLLMVYNQSGIKFKYGLENADPLPQEVIDLNLQELFADDFDVMPNIMDVHTPGLKKYYGPTSPRLFSDWDHAMFQENNRPFSQKDSYLKITANIDSKGNGQGKTGYMASLNESSHTGFAVSYPCYFECKFIAQNVQGAWPSFWLLNTQLGEDAKASVELDVIEAYGSQPDENGRYVNESYTYSTTSHGWSVNQSDHKWHAMEELGNGCSWYQSEHAYGVLITETDTVYFLDGAEIFRHANFVGSDEYFWFIINYAFGSGWKVNAERYGEQADMYVDWVRVYGLEQNLMEKNF